MQFYLETCDESMSLERLHLLDTLFLRVHLGAHLLRHINANLSALVYTKEYNRRQSHLLLSPLAVLGRVEHPVVLGQLEEIFPIDINALAVDCA